MIAIAHFIAISLYIGAAALAAAPIARPVRAPVRAVLIVLAAGVLSHSVALIRSALELGQIPLVGLGPALSFAGFFVAATLLVVELLAREVSLTIIASPLAALITTAANVIGLIPGRLSRTPSVWLESHIALSLLGLAAFAAAAAAGTMYLVERHELKSRRFASVFRLFPPLNTLDRVNHMALLASWAALTLGLALAFAYAINYQMPQAPKMLWAVAAWLAVSASMLARVIFRWSARRSALLSGVAFAMVVALYIVVRLSASDPGVFL